MRRLSLALALLLLLIAARPANAIQFTLFKEHFTLDIIETAFIAYHGDMGPGLQVETDKSNTPTEQLRFMDLLNRLNIALSWRRFRLWTRFDTALYMAHGGTTPGSPADPNAPILSAGPAPGACGPDATTPFVLRSRFCQKPFYGEKVAVEYNGRDLEVTLGDFYVSFGRGLVLSIRKLDELGIDTTLRGGKFIFRSGKFGMTLVAGFTNIQNVDQATGRYVDNPNDFIGGGRTEYRFLDKVNVGLHVVGGVQSQPSGITEPKRPDSRLMYGGTIDAPRLTRWLALYLEGAGQLVTAADRRDSGVALYGTLTGYFKSVAILLEAKYYRNYQPWHASVPSAFVEFSPISYIQPPTAERIVTELQAPIFSVAGIRGRVDWRVNEKVQLFASTAYFEDDSLPTEPLRFHDPYGGAELRWDHGGSHFFPSGGFRYEQDRSTGAMHQEIGHVEWDFTQHLPRGLSIESQGFVLIRREDTITQQTSDGTKTFHPRWTEGTAYLALKWTPHIVAAAGYEWTTQPSNARTQHFFNGSLQWNFTTASSVRLFFGGNRGGLRCISGICRDFPAFSGARLELVVRL